MKSKKTLKQRSEYINSLWSWLGRKCNEDEIQNNDKYQYMSKYDYAETIDIEIHNESRIMAVMSGNITRNEYLKKIEEVIEEIPKEIIAEYLDEN